MALVGGGGAGNVSGSNPVGTGSTLEYIGNGRYTGTSGEIIATNGTNGTLFDFTSGTENLDILLQCTFNYSNVSDSKLLGVQVKLNGQLIIDQVAFTETSANSLFDIDPFYFYLPAYSRLQVETITTDTDDVKTYGTIAAQGI